jgi:DNA-binding PadR family transcriptional regulator
MGRDALGEVEQLVLLAILRLGDEAYGVPIVEEILERTGRDVSRAAVYIALRRLRQKGLVSSWLADPEPVPGGRAKRYFRVEPAGIDRLAEARSTLLSMWDGLQPLLDKR